MCVCVCGVFDLSRARPFIFRQRPRPGEPVFPLSSAGAPRVSLHSLRVSSGLCVIVLSRGFFFAGRPVKSTVKRVRGGAGVCRGAARTPPGRPVNHFGFAGFRGVYRERPGTRGFSLRIGERERRELRVGGLASMGKVLLGGLPLECGSFSFEFMSLALRLVLLEWGIGKLTRALCMVSVGCIPCIPIPGTRDSSGLPCAPKAVTVGSRRNTVLCDRSHKN